MKELYSMEELVPIVSYLSKKYTHSESTSISYEVANQLMEAVMYCIQELDDDYAVAGSSKLPAREAYDIGYKKVLEKTSKAQEKYNELMEYFDDYGNENMRDTVTKAIPGFFAYYDPRLNPTNTIITMDYPVFDTNQDLCGINAIAKYIEAITIEQDFLKIFPKEYIQTKLIGYHTRYQKEFINISEYILRTILSDMMIGKNISDEASERDYSILWEIKQENKVSNLLEVYIIKYWYYFNHQFFDDNQMIYNYFLGCIHDYSAMLLNLGEEKHIKNLVIL